MEANRFLLLSFFVLGVNFSPFAQKPGLQITLLSQEDSSVLNQTELTLLRDDAYIPDVLATSKIERKKVSDIYFVDSAGLYKVCFIDLGCSKKGNETISHYCFSYMLKGKKIVKDTLWAPLVQPYYNLNNGRYYYLYYHSFKFCDGYIIERYMNTTGELRYEGQFKRGRPKGIHIKYNEDGSVCEKIKYSRKGRIKKTILPS